MLNIPIPGPVIGTIAGVITALLVNITMVKIISFGGKLIKNIPSSPNTPSNNN